MVSPSSTQAARTASAQLTPGWRVSLVDPGSILPYYTDALSTALGTARLRGHAAHLASQVPDTAAAGQLRPAGSLLSRERAPFSQVTRAASAQGPGASTGCDTRTPVARRHR